MLVQCIIKWVSCLSISGEYYRGTASFFGQYVSWSAHRYKGRNPDSSMGVLLQEDGGYIIVKHVNLCDEKLKNSLCVKLLKWKIILNVGTCEPCIKKKQCVTIK